MKNHSREIFFLLLGAAAGIAIGYWMATDNKEEIIEKLKERAQKIKGDLENKIERGKKFVDDLRSKVDEIMDQA